MDKPEIDFPDFDPPSDLVVTDITVIKAMERELNVALDAKERFMASASHDLRQPVQALMLFSDLLLKERLDDPARRIADQLRESVGSLGSLLDCLLDISKLEAGLITPAPAPFPLAPLMDRLHAEFAQAAAGIVVGHMARALAVRQLAEHRMASARLAQADGVPAHVRNLQAGVGRLKAHHVAANPVQPLVLAVLQTARGQQLHANADAKERAGLLVGGGRQRVHKAGDGMQRRRALAISAHARQHDAIGAGNVFRLAGNLHLRIQAQITRRPLERLGGGAQVA